MYKNMKKEFCRLIYYESNRNKNNENVIKLMLAKPASQMLWIGFTWISNLKED
jgi:hypothetical protein